MSLEKIRQYYREDGLYLLATTLIGFGLRAARSGMISRKLGVKKIKIGPRSLLRGLSCIQMGEDFSAEDGLWLEAITRHNNQTFSPRIVIGDHARISRWVHIAATHSVEIGDHVLMGSKVIITDHNHGQYSREHSSPHTPPALRPLDTDRHVVIGRNVWLGDGVVVTAGSCVGEGTVIGANSVVQGTIPPFSIASGVPAKVVKTFDFDTQKWIGVE